MTRANIRPTLKANRSFPNNNGWQDRHDEAVEAPYRSFERPIIHMLDAWIKYAEDYRRQYDSPIGTDGVLGDGWYDIGKGIHDLLDGNTGPALDCGTLSTAIDQCLRDNGFENGLEGR